MAGGGPADEDVANMERPFLHDQLGEHAAAFVHRSFQAGADGRTVRIGFQIVQFGDREQSFQQLVETDAVSALVFTTSTSPPHSVGSRPAVANC